VTVLVDTSAWIEFLRGTGGPEHRWLRAALSDDRPLAWTEPVLLELASGVSTPRRAAELRALLQRGPLLRVEGLGDWEAAAGLRRAARARGLAVRSPVDCLVAAVAVREEVPVLARDRDFAAIAAVSGLELVDVG